MASDHSQNSWLDSPSISVLDDPDNTGNLRELAAIHSLQSYRETVLGDVVEQLYSQDLEGVAKFVTHRPVEDQDPRLEGLEQRFFAPEQIRFSAGLDGADLEIENLAQQRCRRTDFLCPHRNNADDGGDSQEPSPPAEITGHVVPPWMTSDPCS